MEMGASPDVRGDVFRMAHADIAAANAQARSAVPGTSRASRPGIAGNVPFRALPAHARARHRRSTTDGRRDGRRIIPMSVSEFLSEHEPFTQLDASRLTELAEAVEAESFAPDELIFDQGAEPVERVRIIVSGSVELNDRGRTLDLLGPRRAVRAPLDAGRAFRRASPRALTNKRSATGCRSTS